jgi:hypothetical protein
MIHELISIHNNCIDLSKVSDIPADMKQIVLSAETDKFYQNVIESLHPWLFVS